MNWVIILGIFLTTCIVTGGAVYALYVVAKKLNMNSTAGEKIEGLKRSLDESELLIAQAISRISLMVSLDQANQLREQAQQLASDIKKDQAELQQVEVNLTDIQTEVSEKEKALISIRAAKEESTSYVRELREKSEDLHRQRQELSLQYKQSDENLTTLLARADLTAQQKTTLNELEGTIKSLSAQIESLGSVHHLALDRLLNLEQQYRSLEEEYEKIVALELSGTN